MKTSDPFPDTVEQLKVMDKANLQNIIPSASEAGICPLL